jgi:hypothetical protein
MRSSRVFSPLKTFLKVLAEKAKPGAAQSSQFDLIALSSGSLDSYVNTEKKS